MPAPRIAVAPQSIPWVEDAIRAGGGEPVERVEEAEGLVWLSPWRPEGLAEALAAAPGVRWVQLPLAGVERFGAAGLLSDGRAYTSAKGLYSEPVAELALALGLAGLRHVIPAARTKTWGRPSGRTLYDRSVAIVGAGGITLALLDLLAPFRVSTTVVRNRPDPVPGAGRTLGPDGLHEALAGADLVILALALTPDTVGLIGAKELEVMGQDSWLVNVARGPHVRTDELVVALRDGVIAGAALDVTDPEPLPDGHPLWDLPNCIITPHTANTPEMALGPLTRRITDNVARFGRSEPLVGTVDPVLGY